MDSLSNLTAEELNEAIDDRNFPRPSHSASGSFSGGSLDHGDGVVDGNGDVTEGGDLGSTMTTTTTRRGSRSAAASENGDSATTTKHVNGFKWANRPKPLDLNGCEKQFHIPGSLDTPRTSTTPGRER